jgi:hypothetical protein
MRLPKRENLKEAGKKWGNQPPCGIFKRQFGSFGENKTPEGGISKKKSSLKEFSPKIHTFLYLF